MTLRSGSLAALLSTASLASIAPLQCGQTPEAELQQDETPGDALWRLAGRFRGRGEVEAERQTLRYLIERYPASRWIEPAQHELARLAVGEPDGEGADPWRGRGSSS